MSYNSSCDYSHMTLQRKKNKRKSWKIDKIKIKYKDLKHIMIILYYIIICLIILYKIKKIRIKSKSFE